MARCYYSRSGRMTVKEAIEAIGRAEVQALIDRADYHAEIARRIHAAWAARDTGLHAALCAIMQAGRIETMEALKAATT